MNNFDVKLHSCHTGLQSHGGEQLLPLFSYGMEALLLSTYLRIQIDAHSLTILSLPNKRHDLLLSTILFHVQILVKRRQPSVLRR